MDVAASLNVRRDGSLLEQLTLDVTTVTVGRASQSFTPDVALEDLDALVSRRHCVFTQHWGSWWVEDTSSRNGTFLNRGGTLIPLNERTQLGKDDLVCIVAARDESGPTSYWELTLVDPSATQTLGGPGRLKPSAGRPCVRWDPTSHRLEVLSDGTPRVVELRKQGYTLVDHMVSRNNAASETVVCNTGELLEAVWGPPDTWDKYRPPTVENLRDLVLAVRKALEPDPKNPKILTNQRGSGYRLWSVR